MIGSDEHGSLWFQIDMFMQTKIAIIVFIRYVVWAAGMSKTLSRPGFLQRSARLLSCCLLLYLNSAGLRQGPGKMLLGAWKVLEFFVTKRVGNLTAANTKQFLAVIIIPTDVGKPCHACSCHDLPKCGVRASFSTTKIVCNNGSKN